MTLREAIKDAAIIVTNILNQPIVMAQPGRSVSLAYAATHYASQNPFDSDLRHLLFTFIEFPEPTETLVRELQLIARELA